jgi:beta-N-acetylhexosaminidase
VRGTQELAGRLIVTGIPAPQVDAATQRALEDLAPSGIVLFARNVTDVERLRDLTRALHSLPSRPLVAIDHEGGRVTRLGAPFTQFPSAAVVGRGGADASQAVGRAIGLELASVGVDIDYAPVLDVHSNPANPIIGDRAFSPDAVTAAALAVAFLRGLHSAGVLSCGKHFPGHGGTDRDSHVELPVVRRSRAELEAVELVPFRTAIAAGLSLLMTAHVRYPALDPDHSATLSPTILRTLLRDQLGFRGVVLTDDLAMDAVTATSSIPEAAIAALRAGADWLLVCHDLEEARRVSERIQMGLDRGELAAGALAESARRIAQLRARLRPTSPVTLPVAAHHALAERLRGMVPGAPT